MPLPSFRHAASPPLAAAAPDEFRRRMSSLPPRHLRVSIRQRADAIAFHRRFIRFAAEFSRSSEFPPIFLPPDADA